MPAATKLAAPALGTLAANTTPQIDATTLAAAPVGAYTPVVDTKGLSPAQRTMLWRAADMRDGNGPGRLPLPDGTRGTDFSAWHRTVNALRERGRVVYLGQFGCYALPGFEKVPSFWALWSDLTEPQQRALCGESNRAKLSNRLIWDASGELTDCGRELKRRALAWYVHN